MVHKMTPLSNPRLLIFFAIITALPLLGLLAFKTYSSVVGAVLTGLGCWLSYRLYRFANPFLKTMITTSDEGITFTLPNEGATNFLYGDIALSGRCTSDRGKPFLFAYNPSRDKLITIPYEYEDMKGLQAELERKTSFEDFHVQQGRSINDILRERFPEVLERTKAKD